MITVIGNLKGGTGKSTVTFNLAVWLASNDRDVTLFDLDPQSTLTDVAQIREEEEYWPQLTISNDISRLKSSKNKEILVDVGTADFDAMKKALGKAHRVVVPVPPSQADVWSTQRFLKIIKEANAGKKMPEVFGFINRADTHIHVRETGETEEALLHLPGIKLIDVRLYQRTAYRRSFSEGLGVFEMEPRSKAAAEVNRLASILFSSLFILDGEETE
jgi:chromosome partitioning protein